MNTSLSTLPESEKLTELLNFATGYQKAKVLFAFTELDIADVSENKKNLRRIYDKLTNGGACLLSGLIMFDYGQFAFRAANGGFILSGRYLPERAGRGKKRKNLHRMAARNGV
ncbi:MAG: hypothetical protein ACR2IA_02760 [Pyrinomonadaceae bacterium]